jgi:hypothetical protein
MKHLTPAVGAVLSLLLIPFSIATSAQRAQRRTTKPQVAAVPAQVAVQGVNDVTFAEINGGDVLRTYPFVKQYLERTQRDMEVKGPLISPKVLVGDIRDSWTHINLLFISERGDTWCPRRDYDDHGCGFDVWGDEGNGYKLIMSAYSKLPLYVLKDREKTSVLVCLQKMYVEWSFEGHTFQLKGPVTRNDIPACK